MNLQIPTPCHENWDNMLPNAQGAFCGSCSKNVVDFSNMSEAAIKAYFLSRPTEKVCGRFTTKQLQPTLEVKLREIPKTSGYSTIFLYALFLVFGTSLFSCTTPAGRMVGEVVVVDEHPVTGNDTSFALDELVTEGDTNRPAVKECVPVKMGKVKVIETAPMPEEHIQGGVMVEPDPMEYTKGDVVFEPDTLKP